MIRNTAPKIKDAVSYNLTLKPYEQFELDNGVPVYVVNAGAQEVLQLEMVFYAGNFFESKNGVASATNFLLKNGTKTRNAFQLNEAFDYYGAHLTRACYSETAVLTLHTLSRHLGNLLPVMQDMLTESVFPAGEFEIFRQNSIQRLKVNLKKSEFVASRVINSLLYGESHPYGKHLDQKDIEGLTLEEVKLFYQQYYLNGNCAIFVSGIVPVDLREQLNAHFGSLSISKPSFTIPGIKVSPDAQRIHRIDKEGVQGAIRLASNFPNRHHPDFKKVVVLNSVFGGFFGSRLMSNIREDKGYTYGIYSYLQNHIQQSALVISTEAGKDVCEAAIREVYHEMKRLCDEPVGEEELMLVKNYMIGVILGDLDGPFHIMAKWKSIILNGLNGNYFYESVDVIKNIPAKEMQELAQKYLQPEKFFELVVY